MTFKPGVALTVFVAVFLPLFVALGFWQLNRAEQKTQLEAQLQARTVIEPLTNSTDPVDYQLYRLTAELDSDTPWLLDNRTWEGQVGYEVWVPLDAGDRWYLASLGWVSGSADRRQLPELAFPTGSRVWVGQWRPLSDSIVLADTPLTDQWPQVIQAIAPQAMAEKMQREAPAGLLQLTAGQPGVGQVIWTPSVMSAQMHTGYALQWFAMAVALAAMYGFAGVHFGRRREPRP
ncbi:SURF1 family protein [Saccharospirillum sp.]|uniref:SURF1 family protein n=1 Tax=Saccharospirillum sp. TaxID=2033801 RepID=UPI0034A0A9DF